MTNPPTDKRGVTDAMVIAALQAYISETGTVDSRDGDLLHIDHEGMRSAIEAALSHQGEVVKVSELRNLAHWWGKKLVRMVGRVNPHEIAGLKRCHEELTALISKAEKV